MNWYLEVLKKYAEFDGRARRSEYWYFALFSALVSMLLAIVGSFIHFEYLYNVYSLAVLVPSIAVGVRRMHDVGKSGVYILIPIYNLVLACEDSMPGDNEYGPNPKTGSDENSDYGSKENLITPAVKSTFK
jgi:uncharacterized membrane protein YhaH (DUF805 family)